MEYEKVFNSFSIQKPKYISIKELDKKSPLSYYNLWIALVDYESDPNDIILYFPKESNGVKLKDFVKSHPHAQYFAMIDWEFLC